MRRFLSAVIAAAAALVAGLATVPATAAATTWTVTPGGAFTNPFARQTRLEDLNFGGQNYGCQPTKMNGTFHSGSGLANPIGQIATMPGPKPARCFAPSQAFRF